jgi:hypothetical protein
VRAILSRQTAPHLLAAQVSLTVVPLVGAALLARSYQDLRACSLGRTTDNVLTMSLSLPEVQYRQAAQRDQFFGALLERVRALPGVLAVGLVDVLPGDGYGGDKGFAVAEHPPLPPRAPASTRCTALWIGVTTEPCRSPC